MYGTVQLRQWLTLAARVGLVWAIFATASAKESSSDLTPRSECGPISLYLCVELIGKKASYEQVRRAVGPADEHGEATLLQLREAAGELGLFAEAVRWQGSTPDGINIPAVLPVMLPRNQRHFVTLADSRGEWLLVTDVPQRPGWITVSSLRRHYGWDGTALYIAASEEDLAPVRSHVGWRWRYVALGGVAGLAVLISPFLHRRFPCRRPRTLAGVDQQE